MRLARFTAFTAAWAALLLCAPVLHARQIEDETAVSPTFEFHSGFWINLHHFLYLQGRIRSAAAASGRGPSRTAEGLPAPSPLAGLDAEQQRAWDAAVDAYAAEWSSRDLLLSSDMAVISNRLAELENCPDLSAKSPPACQAGLRADLVAALDEAAPVYRARWWPEQDRQNRAWIEAAAPLVSRMGVELAQELAGIFGRDWPRQPMRVDVVWSAGPLGAYATLDPVHITVASDDSRNQGVAALEILFQEASHALSSDVDKAIARECRQRDKPIPRDLSQALLFFTARETARRLYTRSLPPAQKGAQADAGSLYDQGWDQYRRLLENYSQPYLDRKTGFDTAIARMISAL